MRQAAERSEEREQLEVCGKMGKIGGMRLKELGGGRKGGIKRGWDKQKGRVTEREERGKNTEMNREIETSFYYLFLLSLSLPLRLFILLPVFHPASPLLFVTLRWKRGRGRRRGKPSGPTSIDRSNWTHRKS